MSTLPEDRCGWCKWMNQGLSGCFCTNPKQDNQSLIEYVYYPFTCKFQEKGARLTEEQLKELGYEKHRRQVIAVNGEDLSYNYYKKIN
jgi:hypothetical protein